LEKKEKEKEALGKEDEVTSASSPAAPQTHAALNASDSDGD